MKKLLIVAGAGASIEFGMPSVSQIDSLFEQWGLELAPLAADPGRSLYSWAKERVQAYACQKTGEDYFGQVNFEQLLYSLQAVASLDTDKNAGYYRHVLNPFIEQLTALPEIVDVYWKQTKVATGHDFRSFAVSLLDRLVTHFREICSHLATQQQDNINLLRSFLLRLQTQFDIGIINLNYDNVMLSAMPELKTGFNTTTHAFDRSLLYNGNWNFCYHMHGSVHFDMRGGKDTEMHKIFWNPDLRSHFAQNAGGRSGQFTREGHAHATTSIIAGLDKPNQLLLEPFGAYYSLMDELIYKADAILFLGYGFNDNHLNSKFLHIRYDEHKYRKVVVVDYAADRQSGLEARSDFWAGNVFRTLPFDRRDFKQGFSEPKIAAEFKRAHTFERSVIPERPLAVWYEGMIAACRYPDKILKELC